MAAKDKKAKKGKKGASNAPAANDWPTISVAAHPRATRSIRQAKAWAGLIGFGLVALMSYRAGVATFEVGIRALVAGVVLYVLVWAASVALWQRLVLTEARQVAERRRDERLAAMRRMTNPDDPDRPGGDEEAAA
jgi:hypothetical protein